MGERNDFRILPTSRELASSSILAISGLYLAAALHSFSQDDMDAKTAMVDDAIRSKGQPGVYETASNQSGGAFQDLAAKGISLIIPSSHAASLKERMDAQLQKDEEKIRRLVEDGKINPNELKIIDLEKKTGMSFIKITQNREYVLGLLSGEKNFEKLKNDAKGMEIIKFLYEYKDYLYNKENPKHMFVIDTYKQLLDGKL